MPSNDLKSRILSLVEGEQVISGRSELNSRVKMAVLGKHCWTISRSKQSVDVRAVANDFGGIKM